MKDPEPGRRGSLLSDDENDLSLSPIERALVSALVSAIVKELRAEQPERGRQPAA
jgi:hypothetical protein